MTNHGDDCYFFYYSTCSKGDDCPFRHCEAAMGSETVCSLWEEGRCFRTVCKFRHMDITYNRKEIACYWENQPAGCQKPHCAFFHERPRYIEGVFVPPNKSLNKHEEQQQPEEPAPQPPTPLPTTANPQLRGVLKTETQEPVPSPTHPPVVINPADDDEDEDDQFSEEGEDVKGGPSPRKLHKSEGSLNFGVSTLEEIRLRRALKASMKRAGYPLQSAETPANGEKENLQSLFRPALFQSGDVPTLLFAEAGRPRGSVAERLGRKMPYTVGNSGDGPPLKRSLAERLGRVMDVEHQPTTQQKPLKTVRERLGLSVPDTPSPPADTSEEPKKVPQQIRIKTLEEIRQERATKAGCETQKDAPETTRTSPDKVSKGPRRAITVKDSSIAHVKTFSEILRAKKKRHEDEPKQSPGQKKVKDTAENAGMKSQEPSDSARTPLEVPKLRVKTLEEIRREKAARAQNQPTSEGENQKSSDSEEDAAKRPRLLLNKPAPHSNVTPENIPEGKTLPAKPAAPVVQTSIKVKVKSFEEIMQEKRLRKQEHEGQARSCVEVEAPPPQTPAPSLKRTLPAMVSVTSAPSSSAAPPVPNSIQKVPVRKLTPLRSLKSATASDAQPAAAVPVVKRVSPPQPAEARGRNAGTTAAEVPTNDAKPKTSPKHTLDTKVRPKLNVKPSVMKVQVKPGQRRKAAERSAVAAVKPLNSTSAGPEQTQQDIASTDTQVLPSVPAEAQLSSAVPQSPGSLLDSTCSPLREELQTVPIFEQSPRQDAKPAAREACAVPQSPVLKSPTQTKPRRPSIAASRSSSGHTNAAAAAAASSAVDDFDMLINEFTDDHLEDEVDPGIGEDDLLQELSEMIDS